MFRTLPLLALALVAVPPAPAHAAEPVSGPTVRAAAPGSLLFVRDDDVWIARADGTGQRRVTTDGTTTLPYRSPTQADDGTIVASRGHEIVRMRPSGRVLNRMDPPPLTNSVSHPIDGVPVSVAVSPDGKHVAYTFVGYDCPVGASCGERFATGFTRADRLTDAEQYGTSYYNDPSWLSNSRTVQGGGSGITVNLQDLGKDPVRWFADSDTSADWEDWEDLSDPAVSPDGRFYAGVRAYGATTHIAWYSLNGNPVNGPAPSAPSRKCVTSADPSLGGPVFSADGGVLAWEEGDDVWATTDPGSCTHQPQVYLTDASMPSFSRAGYSVPAPENVAKPSVKGTAKVGKTLTARAGSWTTGATGYRYQWLRDGKAVRGATRSTYRLVKADRGHRVAVTVTASGPGGSAKATSGAVRVR